MSFCQTVMINDCNDLQMMQPNNSTVYYQLTQNITCSSSFQPIGTTSFICFIGTLDGNGYTISNLNITSSTGNAGIFACTKSPATIKNLILQDITITSLSSNVGSLVGYCCQSTINGISLTTSSNLKTNQIQITNGSNVGGICGYAYLSTITNCNIENTLVSAYGSPSYNLGGLIGYASSSTISNCFNFGIVSNASAFIVNGSSSSTPVGGLIGSLGTSCIFGSGVMQGTVYGGSSVGGIIGNTGCSNISQVFSYQNVTVQASCYVGGLIGLIYSSTNSHLLLLNSYSKSHVIGDLYCGGLIGLITFSGGTNTSNTVNITNCYTSSIVNGTSISGSVVGQISFGSTSGNTISFCQVYFDNQTSSLPSNSSTSGTGTVLHTPQGFSTSNLFSQINSTFDQISIWCNESLRIEPGSPCPAVTILPSTTFTPTTQIPTTQIPTTQIPTKQIPTTQIPITQIPTTQTPTTQFQQTVINGTTVLPTNTSTTQIPTTNTPTTNTPITQIPTTQLQQTVINGTTVLPTNTSTTQIPTTNTPTNTPTIQSPSTLISTSFPTMSISTCFYQVPNCQNCPSNPIQVNQTQFNISCSFIGGFYVWVFKNATSNTIFNNFTITINGSTNFIEGNFTQTSSGVLVFVLNTNQNRSSSLDVSGCISINGTIQLVLDTQPNQGNSTFQIISYNCSQISNVSSSQISISPNYNGEICDQINSQVVNTQNSISISLTSSLGIKCGGPNKGLIIGLSVGIPVGIILITILIIYILRCNVTRQAEQFKFNVQRAIDNKSVLDEKFVSN